MSDSEADSDCDSTIELNGDDGLDAETAGGEVVRYAGAEFINSVPRRAEIVARQSSAAALAAVAPLEQLDPVLFMPVDVEDANEYLGGQPVYVLRIYGAMPDGSKALVVVTGIHVFFDVLARPGETAAQLEAQLRAVFFASNLAPGAVTFETVRAFPDRGYRRRDDPALFVRARCDTLQTRRAALEAVHAAAGDAASSLYAIETKSDDRSSYYRKAARELGLPLSSWAVLRDYEYAAGPTDRAPLCAHVFRVPAAGYAAAPAARVAAEPLLSRDRTLVLAWDIETHSGRGAGDVPMPEHAADHAFMICLAAYWKDSTDPLCRICIVDVDTEPDSRWLTIVCGSPVNVLRAFALCFRALAPDIMVGFNDSGYDWPFIVGKAEKLGLLGWLVQTMSAQGGRAPGSDSAVRRWNYREQQKIKISADETLF